MNSTVKRLAALAALGTSIGLAAPAAGASAATTPVTPPKLAFPLPTLAGGFPSLPAGGFGGLGGLTPGPLAFTGPSVGQVAAVIGPTVITTAPSTFNNTNIQVSAGSNLSGGQAGP